MKLNNLLTKLVLASVIAVAGLSLAPVPASAIPLCTWEFCMANGPAAICHCPGVGCGIPCGDAPCL